MESTESDWHVTSEVILFNGTNSKDENENLLIKYFPKTGVEEEIAQFEASKNNSMVYLNGKLMVKAVSRKSTDATLFIAAAAHLVRLTSGKAPPAVAPLQVHVHNIAQLENDGFGLVLLCSLSVSVWFAIQEEA